MKKPEFVIGYLMNGGAFIQSIKVPKLLDWIKHLEPEELIAFFQDLLELVIQISRGKENIEALAEFLAYWHELALEADSPFWETSIDPEEAEIVEKTADIIWKSLAASISAAMSAGDLGIFKTYDDEEHELTSPWINIVDEQPGPALTTYGTHMEPEPIADITEEQRDEYLALSIFDIPFSVRIHNCLEKKNIETIRDLVRKTDVDLLMYKGFGPGSLHEVEERLAFMGLTLGMDLDDGDYEEDNE